MDLLVLVRHGHARNGANDAERSLSDQGREEVESLAQKLAARRIDPVKIIHSPKLRAMETAQLLQRRLGGSLEVDSNIAPESDSDVIATDFESEEGTFIVVSHLPFLPSLAQRLLGSALSFSTAGAIGIEQTDAGPRLAWKEGP